VPKSSNENMRNMLARKQARIRKKRAEERARQQAEGQRALDEAAARGMYGDTYDPGEPLLPVPSPFQVHNPAQGA
jgi:hypothetical protein